MKFLLGLDWVKALGILDWVKIWGANFMMGWGASTAMGLGLGCQR